MGRLTVSPGRLTVGTNRLTRAADGVTSRTTAPAPPWKAWYKTARWRRLRSEVLVRDNYTCQRSGRVLGGKHPAPDSPVVNHKRAHRGDALLFWDIDNLETVSKDVHDRLIQAEEQATRHHAGVWD